MGACAAYIYIRGEFVAEALVLEEAISEAYKGRNIRSIGLVFNAFVLLMCHQLLVFLMYQLLLIPISYSRLNW